MILTNARVLTFDAGNRVLDSGSVEIGEGGAIGFVRSACVPQPGTIDLHGRLLMPALINCHTHLYSTLARGLQFTGPAPADFPAILKKFWWRLDRGLNQEDIYYSALAGLIESARCGVATVMDHHSSPNACAGSLDQIERAFHEVGLRGATCYEVSDRNGKPGAAAGIRENVRFLERVRPGAPVGAMFGMHASFTVGDATLRACVEANQAFRAGFHVHVAEHGCDVGAVRRLCEAGVLDQKALAAHCVQVTAGERRLLGSRRVNVAHNPQSNCNNAVGVANVAALRRAGVCVGLGSDGCTPRLWDEFKTAYHLQKLRARDPRVPGSDVLAAAFQNSRDLVNKILGVSLGRIEPGARADLLVLDYLPPTPLDNTNLFGHLLYGISNAPVYALMVNGKWVVSEGRCVTVDEQEVTRRAAAHAAALWERL